VLLGGEVYVVDSENTREFSVVLIVVSSVTDGPVESLVNRAMQLERCNLRGNKNISGECYNQGPIHLSRRNGSTESTVWKISRSSRTVLMTNGRGARVIISFSL
jgi:hypothetical protein